MIARSNNYKDFRLYKGSESEIIFPNGSLAATCKDRGQKVIIKQNGQEVESRSENSFTTPVTFSITSFSGEYQWQIEYLTRNDGYIFLFSFIIIILSFSLIFHL